MSLSCQLANVPAEILLAVVDHLIVHDIKNIASTCRYIRTTLYKRLFSTLVVKPRQGPLYAYPQLPEDVENWIDQQGENILAARIHLECIEVDDTRMPLHTSRYLKKLGQSCSVKEVYLEIGSHDRNNRILLASVAESLPETTEDLALVVFNGLRCLDLHTFFASLSDSTRCNILRLRIAFNGDCNFLQHMHLPSLRSLQLRCNFPSHLNPRKWIISFPPSDPLTIVHFRNVNFFTVESVISAIHCLPDSVTQIYVGFDPPAYDYIKLDRLSPHTTLVNCKSFEIEFFGPTTKWLPGSIAFQQKHVLEGRRQLTLSLEVLACFPVSSIVVEGDQLVGAVGVNGRMIIEEFENDILALIPVFPTLRQIVILIGQHIAADMAEENLDRIKEETVRNTCSRLPAALQDRAIEWTFERELPV